MMVKQVKFISWLRADPPNCFPLCHMHWSIMTLSLNAKPLTDGQGNTWARFLLPECRHSVLLSTLPSLLATQAQILVHSTALQMGHQELGLATTPVEGIPCLQHKPEGVSINTKKTQQDSRLHSRWSCAWHFYDDCQLKPAPVPRQTAVLLPGHLQAGGDGGSCHSCKDPLAFERKAGQSHKIKRHSFFRRALTGVHHAVNFSGSTPSCSHIHGYH